MAERTRTYYALFINGIIYGKGPDEYMRELASDYIMRHMYKKERVDISIVDIKSASYSELVEKMKDNLQETLA